MAFRRTPELSASLRQAAEPSADPLTAARDVLWIALMIRKLSEADEVSMAVLRQSWPVKLHPTRQEPSPSGDELAGEFELEFSRRDSLTTLRLCGLLIHCCVFAATADGVYFTSHVEKKQGLYLLEWGVLGQIVEVVCDEVPARGAIRAA